MSQQALMDFLVVFVAILLSYLIHRRNVARSLPPYPPGPRGLPLLGNLLDIPASSEWVTYDKWSKELGSDILYVHAVGNDIIVLNSSEAIDDLLETRSATYSSRPRLPMTLELMGCYWAFSMLPYGKAWRERRRTFSKYFHPSMSELHHASQLKFVREMLPRLLESPEDFSKVLRNAVAGSGISLAYGIPIQRRDDPNVYLAQETIKQIGDSVSPSNFLVNVMPVLMYVPEFMPGASFKGKAREFRILAQRFLSEPFYGSVKAMEAGKATPSLTTSALEDLAGCSADETSRRSKLIMDVAATTFAGAADTTLAAVKAFMAAMLLSPHSQKKAHEELDRVLSGRLPDFNDEASLPYITAIVKEVLRWGVVTPIAVPHTATEADIYKGYYIPKGSIVIPNSWSMLRDETRYGPDTATFRPERFLKNGKLDPDIHDPSDFAFGYGRRTCPGSHIALSLLYITVATILSVFKISEELDENGTPVEPKIEWTSAVINEPMPFKCTIAPRSREAEQLIRGLQFEDVALDT